MFIIGTRVQALNDTPKSPKRDRFNYRQSLKLHEQKLLPFLWRSHDTERLKLHKFLLLEKLSFLELYFVS